MTYARIEIAPSILAANFAKLGEDVRVVEEAGADIIHVDIMDGHFVPNISLGIPVVASLRKATRLPLDVHLMIEQPELYIEGFVRAGGNRILVHQEATVHLDRALAMIRELGAQAGAAINPATPVGMLSEVLDKVDTVLVMTVNPGFGGQRFIPNTYEKIRQLNEMRSIMLASGLKWMGELIPETRPSWRRPERTRSWRGPRFSTQLIQRLQRAS
jgi:ribulose-phosphate 3-epimerase